MDPEIKKLLEAQGTAIAEMRSKNDERLASLEKKGTVDPLVTESLTKANAEINRLSDQIKEVKTALNRRVTVDGEGKEVPAELVAHKAAFENWMRKSSNHQNGDRLAEAQAKAIEAKALSVGSDPDGGFFVTPDTTGRVVKQVFETSPMRQICSVQTIGTNELQGMYDRDEATAQWEGETESGAETNTPQVGMWKIPVFTLKARPKATQQFLEDANMNPEAWLADHVARKFARTEANVFCVGNGINKPRGFLTYASGTSHGQIEQVHLGSISAIADPDKILSLIGALKSEYRPGSCFLMSREGLTSARMMKQDGKYVWVDQLATGPGLGLMPGTLFGYPVYEAADMPAIASASLSVAFGNFKEGYQIVDRAGLSVLRDPYTAEPFVKFITRKRVGGAVVNFEAIKIGIMSV